MNICENLNNGKTHILRIDVNDGSNTTICGRRMYLVTSKIYSAEIDKVNCNKCLSMHKVFENDSNVNRKWIDNKISR